MTATPPILPGERCQCLCAPLGHHFSCCTGNAAADLTVPFISLRSGRRVPACPGCHEAAKIGLDKLLGPHTIGRRVVEARAQG
jgi:hypothetical protein